MEGYAVKNVSLIKLKMTIIDFNVGDMGRAVSDSQMITVNEICDFSDGYTLKHFNLIKLKWPTCGHH